VLLTMPFSAAQIEKISGVSSRIVVTQREARSPEDIADVIEATDVLYTWNVLPSSVADAPRLRWVQLHSAGIDAVLESPLYVNNDVAFTTGSGIHAIGMAEYTMAMVRASAGIATCRKSFTGPPSGLWAMAVSAGRSRG
jgi:phosphoglycerate dehydrogenase-like enzyme